MNYLGPKFGDLAVRFGNKTLSPEAQRSCEQLLINTEKTYQEQFFRKNGASKSLNQLYYQKILSQYSMET